MSPEQIRRALAAIETNGLRAEPEVVLDWNCPKGQCFFFEGTVYKSPQDATPEELATCRRQNDGHTRA